MMQLTTLIGRTARHQGGHAWEAGYIDQPIYRDRTQAFYRTYVTEEEQYAAYDGMFAHYLLSIERVDRVFTWTTPEELREYIEDTYASD